MTEAGSGIEEEGIVSMGRKFYISDEEIVSELQSEMGLTPEKAQEYLAFQTI